MTAINIVVRPDKAILMTDAALYDRFGTIVGFGPKAYTIPGLNCAIAVRGADVIATHLQKALAFRYNSFDEMCDKLDDDIRIFDEDTSEILEASGFPSFDLYIAGWSDRENRAKALNYCSREGDFQDQQVTAIDEFSINPDPEEWVWRDELRYVGVDLSRFDELIRTFDATRHGVPIMEAQRRDMDQLEGDEDGAALSLVGGHMVATEITREGITQRVVHRWADEVGVPIEPQPFDLPKPGVPMIHPGMSRAERRRAEKLNRKSA